ncbi:MAG: hypothetical protein FJ164_11220 [Gammaproteobacteria bacterium]|nr:hypothetical protein [Gammaproteobacteria bacterium]
MLRRRHTHERRDGRRDQALDGATEEHLVEELAGIFWRKRRLRLAEGAVFRRGLAGTIAPTRGTVKAALAHLDVSQGTEGPLDAIQATAVETEDELRDLSDDEAMTRRALALLESGRKDRYKVALQAVREDTREWWEECLDRDSDELDEDEEIPAADADGLRGFLETKILPWYETRRKELLNRPLIRDQAFGEALEPVKLERLSRYEVHLDRKLERTLAMLVRLRQMRSVGDYE